MAENNNKFKKPVLPGQGPQLTVSPEIQESLQKIGDSITRAFGRDGKKILRTDREGNIDIGATMRAFTGAFNKSSGAIVNEAANALRSGTSISADIAGVKIQADMPPQDTSRLVQAQQKSVGPLAELGEIMGDIGIKFQDALKPKQLDLDAGGLPTVPTPGAKQDSMRMVNMMVNSAVGAFILTEEMRGMKDGTIKEGKHLLSSNDLLDYGMNMRQKSMEVGAHYAAGDPALTYLALSKLQESGIFKGPEKEYAQQAMEFLKSHNDLGDLKSERMQSAQEFFGKIPSVMADVMKADGPAAVTPDARSDSKRTLDALKL